ncbi:MAG TPA: L17 family ribosomal protein, partial [Bacillota bacterium]|nr:L17 family ribosomal protein [Bacillota bacterium]
TTTIEVTNDKPSKLNARRKMMSVLYKQMELREEGETKKEYADRSREVKHPLVEKIFSEYGPKYRKRKEELGQGGGYTRILKKGPRRGDGAEVVIIELV